MPQDIVQKKTKKDKYGKQKTTKVQQAQEDEEGANMGGDFFQVEQVDGGDEFLAVKPWIGQMKEPTDYKKPALNQNKPPKVDITLEYVHGYRSKDCRNNVRYLKSGCIVYHAAAVGIVVDTTTTPYTQRFFNLHTDDITAMDVHPNGILVATGEVGPKPIIYMWDSNTMLPIFTFKGGLLKGIANLGFSPSGTKLVAVAIDNDHTIGVYDTEVGTMLCMDKGDTNVIIDVKFKNDNEFVSVGPKHFMAWTFQNKSIKSKRGTFGQENNMLKCVCFNGDTALVGSSDGKLQTWMGNSIGKTFKLHEGSVDAVWADSQYVCTGGSDGVINILDKSNYTSLHKLVFDQTVKISLCSKIRSVAFSNDSKRNLIVGTYGSEIYELQPKEPKINTGSKFTVKEITKGHYTPNQKWTNEVWGLGAFKQDGDKWASCSDDGTLRIWSASQRKQLKIFKLDTDANGEQLPPDPKTKDLDESAKGRCLDISPDDKFIAVGCKDGTLRIIDLNAMKHVKILKHAKEWISEVRFSPDGSMLAVGSHDNAIYVYDTKGWVKRNQNMKKHSSFITHLDWSEDGQNLHSTCGGYELLYWNATTGEQLKSGATQFRDEQWADWTCTLGWPVQGIWPPFTSGDDINYVCRSANKTAGDYHLLACGDDFGKVKILRYPSIQKGSLGVEGAGHSSHVTCVKWSNNDSALYSAGGEDNCVFQWRVTPQV